MGDSFSSPNLAGLDRFAFEPRRVDKPWGYELIWALTEDYCGKVLFVRAGESLSLQFHRRKDESWYMQAGRAELQVGAVGEAMLQTEVLKPGASFRFRPGTVHRVKAIEDTSILEVSTTSSGSRTPTDGRERASRENLATLVVRFRRDGRAHGWTGGCPHGLVAADASVSRARCTRRAAANRVRLPALRRGRARPAPRAAHVA